MNQISKHAVDEFEKRLQAEKELLFGCETERGFFNRISGSFLPFLRTEVIASLVVTKWQEASVDLSLVEKANEQLRVAFLQLWECAAQSNNRALKRQLIEILRQVRGPARYIEISSGNFPRRISYAIQPLYAEHIAKTEHFSFAPAVLELERREAAFHALADNDPSFLWIEMITVENCQKLIDVPVFSIRWKMIRGDKKTMGIRAYAARQEYHLAMTADELRLLGRSKRAPHYFVREKFERYIHRLCQKLLHALRNKVVQEPFFTPVSLEKEDKDHWRTKQYNEDLGKLTPIGTEVWKAALSSGQDPSAFSQSSVADKIQELAEKRQIALHSKARSRYEDAAKQTDPRIYENGKYLGLKSGYQLF